jgi:hypothetical protein
VAPIRLQHARQRLAPGAPADERLPELVEEVALLLAQRIALTKRPSELEVPVTGIVVGRPGDRPVSVDIARVWVPGPTFLTIFLRSVGRCWYGQSPIQKTPRPLGLAPNQRNINTLVPGSFRAQRCSCRSFRQYPPCVRGREGDALGPDTPPQ